MWYLSPLAVLPGKQMNSIVFNGEQLLIQHNFDAWQKGETGKLVHR